MNMNISIKLIGGQIDASIANIIELSILSSEQFPFCLITSIDSTRDLELLTTTKKILAEWPECQLAYKALLVQTKTLVAFDKKYSVFHGFDEMWFFETPPKNQLPDNFWITAPRKFPADLPQGLFEWMKVNSCGLGFGDGIGLNFVTTYEDIAKRIQEFSE
jgi:hypothetical protein